MNNLNNVINCKINYDLLINCVLKSKDIDECYILKHTYNKFCIKKKIDYISKK